MTMIFIRASVLGGRFLELAAAAGVGRRDAAADLGAEELGRQASASGAVRGRFLEILGGVRVVHAVEAEGTGQIALGHEPG
jgi:hypothetical protein